MTLQVPQDRNHVVDLLPAYLNGTLDLMSSKYVEKHLLNCQACQLELNTWEMMQDVTRLALESSPLPSVSVLDNVWAQVDASAQEEKTHQPARELVSKVNWKAILSNIQHCWLVFKAQISLLHKSIWTASLLVMAFCCLLVLFTVRDTQTTRILLALFTSIVGAAGVAFIYGPQNDTGFEITLSTPTSIRLVIVSRMTLVIGYDIVLAALASFVLVMIQGGDVGQLVQLWLGPLLLLSSLSLLLSLLLGSLIAAMSTIMVAVAQVLQSHGNEASIAFVHSIWWQTNPMMLLLAILFILFALFYAPRQTRLN